MSDLRREIRFEPRDGQMRIRFLLHGDLGATQFLFVFNHSGEAVDVIYTKTLRPQGYDVGFHSKHKIDYAMKMEECDVLDQGHCWYDGSSLQAEDLGRLFLQQGEPVVWEWLEDRYVTWLVEADVGEAA